MPIYEYACQKCQSPLEILQKINDKPLTKCPKCGGKLEKQWSQTSFQLKGSGWYVTDYARKGAAADAKDKTETGAAPADAETKPVAAATETAPTGGEKKDDQKKAKKGKSPAPTSSGKD